VKDTNFSGRHGHRGASFDLSNTDRKHNHYAFG
jgi:hypothetical protein